MSVFSFATPSAAGNLAVGSGNPFAAFEPSIFDGVTVIKSPTAEMQAGGKDDAQTLISLAAFACADAYRDVTFQAIQLHGGIAYTWEHPAHLYWRRARTGLWLFGSSDQNRENYLSQLEAA